MRALVLAQGTSRRWTRPDGTLRLDRPKHFIEVDGETLLARTVRQLTERGVETIVVAPDDDRYRVGARVVTLDDPQPTGHNLDKLFGTVHLWATDDRTVIMFGDVHYTDSAVDAIVKHDDLGPHWFRRPGPSAITGHPWDETFAFSFGPQHHARVLERAEHVTEQVRLGRLKAAHMRCHYAAMLGMSDLNARGPLVHTPHQTVIDDWTDDIDTWSQWCDFFGRWMAGKINVHIATPWSDGDDWRRWSRAWTHRHWAQIGVPVHYGHCPTTDLGVNRSAGRNAAARAATDAGADVIFLADADTYVDPPQMWAAAHLAMITGRPVRAFERWHRLTQSTTQLIRAGREPARRSAMWTNTNHASGAIAIRTDAYWATGGFDERFPSWGGEDRAWWLAVNTLLGWPRDDICGDAWHLWHPTSPERNKRDPQYQANVELAMRYKRAAGVWTAEGILPAEQATAPRSEPDVAGMRAILSEPGAPLDPEHTQHTGTVVPPPALLNALQRVQIVPTVVPRVTYVNLASGARQTVPEGSPRQRRYDGSAEWAREDDTTECPTCGHLTTWEVIGGR